MHVTIRRYAGRASVLLDATRKVAEGLLPRLRQEAGFQGYCVFAGSAGEIVSVSLFRDAAAEAANCSVRDWVQANLRDLLPDPPEVTGGETVIEAMAPPAAPPGR